MFKTTSKNNEVYLIAYVDELYNVINFPMGGSSTKPSIKAHDNLTSAKRSLRFFPRTVIVKAIHFEIVEENK